MPHGAQQIHKTQTTAVQPTKRGIHPAAMRMSRLRKSFGWRMSSTALVADATLAPPPSLSPYFRLISDKHIHFCSFMADVVYFAFG